MDALFQPVANLKGIGAKRAEALAKLGIQTPYDLLYHVPRSYLDYSHPVPVAAASLGETNVIRVQIVHKLAPQFIRKGMTIFKAVATDGVSDVTVVMYNNQYGFQALHPGSWYRMSGKIQGNLLRREIHAPHVLADNRKELIYPAYPLTSGITANLLVRAVKQALELMKAQPFEWMPEQMRLEHGLLPLGTALEQVHFPSNPALMETARRRLAFDELLQLQLGMLLRRADNRTKSAYPMRRDTDLSPYYAALPFTMTDGQKHAVEEITADLCGDVPMNRLLQGDVGSGKTAVAAAACYFAAQNGMQCALMAPTEILARQHYESAKAMLEPLGIRCGLLIGSMRPKAKREAQEACANGEYQAVFGTHALISEKVAYQKLGLVVTDEQHRFGVMQRSTLQQKGADGTKAPHVLVMSATPIPRTLALILYGDLDVSIVDELPPGRTPVKTRVVPEEKRAGMYGFLRQEVLKGHQAYVVCPLVEDSEMMEDVRSAQATFDALKNGELSGLRVGLTWGAQPADEKAQVLSEFSAGNLDVLVSTTVIEVGVNVPNASVMVIENAERFGLSQLHQLRGRVGRGSAESWCFLLAAENERLRILTQTNDGFIVAQKDLELRGPGDLMGTRQSGEMMADFLLDGDVKLLDEAAKCMKRLREDPKLTAERQQVEAEALHNYRDKLEDIAMN